MRPPVPYFNLNIFEYLNQPHSSKFGSRVNNALYKIENSTYKCDLAYKYELVLHKKLLRSKVTTVGIGPTAHGLCR